MDVSDHGIMHITNRKYQMRRRPQNVMKMVEDQIIRNLTRHIQQKTKQMYSTPKSTKVETHLDEIPGEMKVVISKKNDEVIKAGDDASQKQQNDKMPTLVRKTASDKIRLKLLGEYERSLRQPNDGRALYQFPKISKMKTKQDSSQKQKCGKVRNMRKQLTNNHGDPIHPNLPKRSEAPNISQHAKCKNLESETSRYRDARMSVREKKKNPPISESRSESKVKLPVLGKGIGRKKDVRSENASKLVTPSLGKINHIIHGLYGNYFNFKLDRYHMYEGSINDPVKAFASDSEASLHFVTPLLDESKASDGSHTLRLFKSSKKNSDDLPVKSQKMTAQLRRSKYGKAVATINTSTETVTLDTKNPSKNFRAGRKANGRPIIDTEYTSFLKKCAREEDINTTNQRVLRKHFAYQLALYHEQIAKENRSLHQNPFRTSSHANEHVQDKETNLAMIQFAEDINRYAQCLESYVQTKERQLQEPLGRLTNLSQRQRKREKNRYLEIVQNRDALLDQVAISRYQKQNRKTPKMPSNNQKKDDVVSPSGSTDNHRRLKRTPLHLWKTKEKKEEKATNSKRMKIAMGTKVYRIFGERSNSVCASRQSVAQAQSPYSPSDCDKHQVFENSLSKRKTAGLTCSKFERWREAMKPHEIKNLTSRLQVTTKYKLDRQFMTSLAFEGT